MKRKLTALLKNLLLFFLSFGLSLFVAEIAVRIFIPQNLYRFPKNMFVTDPLLGFKPNPGFQGIMRNAEYKTHIKINSTGQRDKEYGPKNFDTFRILTLGDSFTMGNNVELNETYTKVLESMLNGPRTQINYEVINAGVAGYGTKHELLYLQTEGLKLHPDLVLVGFYVGNDVENNLYPAKLTVEDGYLVNRNRTKGLLPMGVRHFLSANSQLYLFLRVKYHSILAGYGKRPKRKTPHFIEIFSKEYTPKLQMGWKKTLKLLAETVKISRVHGTQVVIVIMPNKFQVFDEIWTKALLRLGLDKEDYDLEKPSKILLRFGKENDVLVIDLLPRFRSENKEKQLYHVLDGHWNQDGNRLAAREIFNLLMEQKLIPSS